MTPARLLFITALFFLASTLALFLTDRPVQAERSLGFGLLTLATACYISMGERHKARSQGRTKQKPSEENRLA
jgi:F0F1-type ATP synthase assembly protein I